MPPLSTIERRFLVLELIGPAGAGKSTLMAAVGQRDRSIGSLRVELQQHGPLAVRGFLRALPSLTRPRSILRALPGLEECRAVLLDEGPVFRLTRQLVRGRSSGPALSGLLARRALHAWAGSVDFLLWLDAPDSILMERIRSRGKAHALKDASDAELGKFLARYRNAYEIVARELRRRCGTPLLRLDSGSATPEQLADQVLSLLPSEGGSR
ncbi:MAG: hypothetical protein ACK47B_23070 [Armatimonadota bacterium]